MSSTTLDTLLDSLTRWLDAYGCVILTLIGLVCALVVAGLVLDSRRR